MLKFKHYISCFQYMKFASPVRSLREHQKVRARKLLSCVNDLRSWRIIDKLNILVGVIWVGEVRGGEGEHDWVINEHR